MRARLIASSMLFLALAGGVLPARAQEPGMPMSAATADHKVDGGTTPKKVGDCSKSSDLSSSWFADLLGKVRSFLGLPVSVYASDPNEPMEQLLLLQFGGLRNISSDVRGPLSIDQPGHMTYQRIHGGIGP